jgi:L-2,4-diaminobutyrate decarboxylase
MELHHDTKPAHAAGALLHEENNGPLARAREAADDDRRRQRAQVVLAGSRDGLTELPRLLASATNTALSARRLAGPLPSGTTRDVLGAASALLGPSELANEGIGCEQALKQVAHLMVEYGLDLAHPRAAAHLQPPPLSVAVVADALASVSNASLDTYDSGPSGIAVERWLIAVLAKLSGLGARADGVLTPGGSLSNMLGLLLARDAAALRRKIDARRDGVAGLGEPVVFCSELAHFSVHRACAALGLGERAVRAVPTDGQRRMSVSALAELLAASSAQTPLAIVATAGTTDFGSIDPLPEIAALAREHKVWLHVDAAYGFGALFSERLASRLTGIELADSITLDLHKLGWQPAAASVLLVRDTSHFSALDREVAYLNPSDDTAAGLDGLLGRSFQTTRRPDALKIVSTFLAHGRCGLGDMVDICHDLARYAEQRILKEPELELVSGAELTTVVFRYRCRRRASEGRAQFEDEVNGTLRRRLLERGIALIGRTTVALHVAEARGPARVCLKFTLLNPTATSGDIDDLVHAVLRAGRDAERHVEEHLT